MSDREVVGRNENEILTKTVYFSTVYYEVQLS